MNRALYTTDYHDDYEVRAASAAPPKWKSLQQQYPNNMAFFLMSTLAFFTLIHVLTIARRLLRPRSPQQVVADLESSNLHSQKASWRRLPSALASTLRIVAFRFPVPLGFGFQLLGAELFIIVTYLCVLFIWTLIDSECTHTGHSRCVADLTQSG
jgi:ferric-chelate reductase